MRFGKRELLVEVAGEPGRQLRTLRLGRDPAALAAGGTDFVDPPPAAVGVFAEAEPNGGRVALRQVVQDGAQRFVQPIRASAGPTSR
jgi:hypothetical protein